MSRQKIERKKTHTDTQRFSVVHFIGFFFSLRTKSFLCCGYLFDETPELVVERITKMTKINEILLKGDRQQQTPHSTRNHNIRKGTSYYYYF